MHAAFLSRPDIAVLPAEEQASRWADHKQHINRFLARISTMECVVLEVHTFGGAGA